MQRIRAEYQEMPGLSLNLAQACRMWHLDQAFCLLVLDHLVGEGSLRRTRDQAYIAVPNVRPRPAKAALPASAPAGARVRHGA